MVSPALQPTIVVRHSQHNELGKPNIAAATPRSFHLGASSSVVFMDTDAEQVGDGIVARRNVEGPEGATEVQRGHPQVQPEVAVNLDRWHQT